MDQTIREESGRTITLSVPSFGFLRMIYVNADRQLYLTGAELEAYNGTINYITPNGVRELLDILQRYPLESNPQSGEGA